MKYRQVENNDLRLCFNTIQQHNNQILSIQIYVDMIHEWKLMLAEYRRLEMCIICRSRL